MLTFSTVVRRQKKTVATNHYKYLLVLLVSFTNQPLFQISYCRWRGESKRYAKTNPLSGSVACCNKLITPRVCDTNRKKVFLSLSVLKWRLVSPSVFLSELTSSVVKVVVKGMT